MKGYQVAALACIIAVNALAMADDVLVIGGQPYLRKEFNVRAQTSAVARRPGISYLPDGSITACWDTDSLIYARRFSADGTALSDDIMVGSSKSWYAAVAGLPSGRSLVTYQQNYDIYAAILTSTGSVQTPAFLVNTNTYGTQHYPQAAADALGQSLLVWQGPALSGPGTDIFARRLDALGNPLSEEFRVNTTSINDQDFPDVAVNAAGQGMVVWNDHGGTVASTVRAQRFEGGLPAGPELVVAGAAGYASCNTHVAVSPAGMSIVAWEKELEGSATGHIYVQRYDQAGSPLGAAVQVTDRPYHPSMVPELGVWDDGKFVVTWYEYSAPTSDIYARLYNADGTALSDVFVVNGLTAGFQYSPAVSCGPNGSMAFAWRNGSDQSYVTLLVPEPTCLLLVAIGGLALIRRRRPRS